MAPWVRGLIGLALVLAVLAATAGTARAQQTINPTGGTNATNGLRIVVSPDTTFQIFRNNARQLFKAEGLTAAIS